MDLRAYLATIRRSWLLLVVPVVVGLVAAVVVLTLQTPKYLSTANVYVSVGNASNANDLSQANSFAQSAAANFAALAEQPYVLYAVRQRLDLPLSSDQIAKEMTTSVAENTSIISIEVLDESPERAALIANGTAEQLSTAVADLNPTAADGTQTVKVTVVKTAVVADAATVPNRPLGIALGLLAGLLLGVVLVILRELLDTRVRHVADLQKLAGAPVVGQIPRSSSVAAHPLVLVDDPASAAAEGFRLLQLNTEYLRAPGGVVTVGIASAVPSEGKSTVAANLALALAAAGHRVALVDADLRRPRLHTMFGIDNALGLTEVLIGRADVFDVVQPWGTADGQIAIVPAGSTPPNPGELLQSPRLRSTLERLAEEADVVIVDGPPLLAVADSAVLARTVDAVLLVASLQRSHRAPVSRAVAGLHNVGARVLGTVATVTRPSRADSDAYLRYTKRAAPIELPAPVEQESAEATAKPESKRRRRTRPTAAAVPAEAAPVEVVEERAASEAAAVPPAESVAEAPEQPVEAEPVTGSKPRARKPRWSRRTPAAETAQVVEEQPPSDAADEHAESTPLAEWFRPAVIEDEQPTAVEPEPEPEVEQDERPARAGSRPTRVPAARDSDARTLRSAKRTMSDEELRILRSFSSRMDQRFGG